MAKLNYKLEEFNTAKAMEGALCVVVKASFTDSVISNIADSNGTANTNFIGTGICSYNGQDTYSVSINSKAYKFNESGEGLYGNSDCKVMLGTAILDLTTSGNMAKSNSTTTTVSTRADGVSTSTNYGQSSKVIIDTLNARDEFAVHALRELLCHVSDPSSVSDSEMNYYCDKAYRWAANMMLASANARGTYTDKDASTSSSTTSKADVSTNTLSSNTEKLLNNIVAALEKTDYAETDATSGKVTAYHERVKLQFTELINFLNAYVKNGDNTLALKDLIASLDSIKTNIANFKTDYSSLVSALNNIRNSISGSSTDFSGLIQAINYSSYLGNLVSAVENIQVSSTVDIGSSGLGRDKDHPFYMSGGAFPSRQALASAFASTLINSFLTFNANGAVGYSTLDEVKKAVNGWISSYASLDALYTAMESKVQATVDTRVKAWLNATKVTINGASYSLTVPSSI